MDDEIKKKQKRKKIIIISIISFVVLVSIIFSIIYYKKKKAAEDALKKGAPTGDLNDRNYKPKPIFNDKGDGNGDGDDKNKGVDIDIDRITNKQNGADGDIVNVPGDLYGKGKNKTKISSSSLSYTNLSKIFGGEDGNGSGSGVDIFNPVNDTGGFLGLANAIDPNVDVGKLINDQKLDQYQNSIDLANRIDDTLDDTEKKLEDFIDDYAVSTNTEKDLEEKKAECYSQLSKTYREKFSLANPNYEIEKANLKKFFENPYPFLGITSGDNWVPDGRDENNWNAIRHGNQNDWGINLEPIFNYTYFTKDNNWKLEAKRDSDGEDVWPDLTGALVGRVDRSGSGPFFTHLAGIDSCLDNATKNSLGKNEYNRDNPQNQNLIQEFCPIKKLISELQHTSSKLRNNQKLGSGDFDLSKIKKCLNTISNIAGLVCGIVNGNFALGTGFDTNKCIEPIKKTLTTITDPLEAINQVKTAYLTLQNLDRINLESLSAYAAVETIQSVSTLAIKKIGDRKGAITNVFTQGKSFVNDVAKNLESWNENNIKTYLSQDRTNPYQKQVNIGIVNDVKNKNNIEIDFPLPHIAKDEICNDGGEREKQKALGFYKIQIKQGTSDYVEIPNANGNGTSFIWIPWTNVKDPSYKYPIANVVDIEAICQLDLKQKDIQTANLTGTSLGLAIAFNKGKREALITFISLAENGYGGPKTKTALTDPINSKYSQITQSKRKLDEQVKKTEENEKLKYLSNNGIIGQEQCLDENGNEKAIDPKNPKKAYCVTTKTLKDSDSAYNTRTDVETAKNSISDSVNKIADKVDSDPSCVNQAGNLFDLLKGGIQAGASLFKTSSSSNASSTNASSTKISSKCLFSNFLKRLKDLEDLSEANKNIKVTDAVQKGITNSLSDIASQNFGLDLNVDLNSGDINLNIDNLIKNGSYIEKNQKDPTEYIIEIRNDLNLSGILISQDLILNIQYIDNKKNTSTTTSKRFQEKYSVLSGMLVNDLKNKGIDKFPKSGNVEITDKRRYKEDDFIKNYKKNLDYEYSKINNNKGEGKNYYVYNSNYISDWKKEYNIILQTTDKKNAELDFKKENGNKTIISCEFASGLSKVYDKTNKKVAVVYLCKYKK